MRTQKEGKPQLTNMSRMKKNCISVKCGSVGLLGNGYVEIESTIRFSQKVLVVLETLLHWEVDFIISSLSSARLKIRDQKIE